MIMAVFIWFIIGAVMATFFLVVNIKLDPDGWDVLMLFGLLLVGPVVLATMGILYFKGFKK